MRRLLPLVAALAVASCGSGSPAAPAPVFPTVSGTYTGAITIAYPEVGQSVTCPATTTVTQNNANISIAPLILSGPCSGLSIPIGATTIDLNGSFGNIPSTTITATCGSYTATGSGGFFGRQFQFSLTAVSTTCLNFNFTAVLTR